MAHSLLFLLGSLCLLGAVAGQTKNNNGNPTGEIGAPAFDEIVVQSTLTVRGKSGSRAAKTLSSDSAVGIKRIPYFQPNATSSTSTTTTTTTTSTTTVKPDEVIVKRSKRTPRRDSGRYGGYPMSGGFGGSGGFGSSSSSAHASSNAFNHNTPFGSFGGSASQSASQSQSFGPNGGQAASGQSASQTYRLPNGNQISLSFSSGFSSGNKGPPSFTNSHAVTLTKPNGQTYNLGRGK